VAVALPRVLAGVMAYTIGELEASRLCRIGHLARIGHGARRAFMAAAPQSGPRADERG
jgi:hypothetical protein